jgi:UrcA family protein
MRSQIVVSCLMVVGMSGPLAARALTLSTPQNDGLRTQVVGFADLNLQSPQGIRILYARIRTAAQEVCEPAYFLVGQSNVGQWRCQKRAIEQAVAAVRSTSLTAFQMSSTTQTEHASERARDR